jgi:hypothetical protein
MGIICKGKEVEGHHFYSQSTKIDFGGICKVGDLAIAD